MPELAEVITVTKDLHKELKDKKISNIKFVTGYEMDKTKLVGREIIRVYNLSKLIIIEMENDINIAIHLGMTGLLQLNHKDAYTKVEIFMDENTFLSFSDIRKFGFIKIWDMKELEKYSNNIGPNILEIAQETFNTKLKNRRIGIREALLNQKIISGIGNVYANDALFLSKINPLKPANSLSTEKNTQLLKNLKEIINEGIKNRGISMRRFVDIYGKKGTQQEHFRVYSKTDTPCIICTTSIKFVKHKGRGIYYCPNCQQ